ncbi:MAG: nucleotidyltransferase substrate binding protein [Candidatus Brennerbacteria bacterium]|nr:nucleotidyltransferase substrate binding protein [Candidatus Brennerbacteria bacterium]
MTKFQSLYEDFAEALIRFEEILREEKTEIVRDAAILRFEIIFELSWKSLKAFLEENGVSCVSPLNCFKEGYRQKLLDYEEIWIELVQARNKTVHTYDEKLADEIYKKLPLALKAFQKLKKQLEKGRVITKIHIPKKARL